MGISLLRSMDFEYLLRRLVRRVSLGASSACLSTWVHAMTIDI